MKLNDNLLKAIIYSSISGLSVAIFLILYQPFGTYDFTSTTKYWFLTGYGLIAFISVFFSWIIASKYWALESFAAVTLVIIASALMSTALSFIYKQWYFEALISLKQFLGYLPFSLMTLPLPLGIILGLEYKTRPMPSNLSFRLNDSNDREFIQFKAEELLVIKAADNYIEVSHVNNGAIQVELLRLSLVAAKQQLMEHPEIMQCHRSYLVNMSQVSHGNGTKQAFSLLLRNSDLKVPVSRKHLTEVQNKLGNVTV